MDMGAIQQACEIQFLDAALLFQRLGVKGDGVRVLLSILDANNFISLLLEILRHFYTINLH